MNCGAVSVRRKGHGHKGPRIEKKRRTGPECSNSMRTEAQDGSYVRGRREHPVGSSGTPQSSRSKSEYSDLGWAMGNEDWTFWKGRPHPKLKKRRLKHSPRKEDDCGTSESLKSL